MAGIKSGINGQINNNIVTDGLVFYVDAAYKKSYPRSGTTWSNIISGNNGTLTNGPTFSSDNQGSIVFDGSDDYVDFGTDSLNSVLSLQGDFTLNFWINADTFSGNDHIISREDTNTYGWRIQLDGTNIALRANSTTQATKYETPKPGNTGQWYNMSFTYDGGTDPLGYMDGQSVTLTEGFGAWFAPPNNAYDFRIGKADSYTGFDGKMSNVSIYNKALSAQEVLQNYQAQKERFGL